MKHAAHFSVCYSLREYKLGAKNMCYHIHFYTKMMKLYVFHADKTLYITFKYGDDILKKIYSALVPISMGRLWFHLKPTFGQCNIFGFTSIKYTCTMYMQSCIDVYAVKCTYHNIYMKFKYTYICSYGHVFMQWIKVHIFTWICSIVNVP